MATKKKGCGFLTAALILFLIGGGIVTLLGLSALPTGLTFVKNFNNGEVFVAPESLTYSAEKDSAVTVWLNSDDTNLDLRRIRAIIAEEGKQPFSVQRPEPITTIGSKHLIGSFNVEKGKTYNVSATGATEGQVFQASAIETSGNFMAAIGKALGALVVTFIFGILILIFTIIGLVKLMRSKNKQPSA
ncbi:MAG: hypothetical protein ACSHX0_08755 [Akkermansiaceae bacterium]